MSEFEEQLKQEELERQQSESGETNPYEYRDSDGTLYEWDTEKNAWFPKIDEDFIAKYQMNYGVDQTAPSGKTTEQETTENQQEYSKEEYDKYWRDYYCYYYGNDHSSQPSDQEQNAGTQEKPEDQGTATDRQSSGNKVLQAGQRSGEQDVSDDDPDSHYHHYFSQYYDENYVAPATESKAPPQTAAKEDAVSGQEAAGKKKASKPGEKRHDTGWVEIEEDKNTNVYVSGLPLDVTDEEFAEFMSKCGLIMPDLMSKEPKIKLYRDDQGQPKGDGRCCYNKVESVALALQILDGSDLRGHKVHVERAKFTMKGQFDPKKKRKKLAAKEKKKLLQQQQKLLDWKPDVDDTRKRWEKVVVLKHMFDPKEFEENPLLINELREDVRQESSKFGEVKKVVLYDRHPEGVMTVHFKEFEFADACVAALNGRWFAKKRISAEIWDGKTKYEVEESTAERDERLQKWENFLQAEDTKNKNTETSSGESRPSAVEQNSENPETSASSAAGTRDPGSDAGASRTVTEGETNCDSAGASQAR